MVKTKTVLQFPAESIADINAVKGLIRVLGLGRSSIVIRFGDEITESMAKKAFPGFRVTGKKIKACLQTGFNTEGRDRLSGTGGVIFNYVPYKFFALSPSAYSSKKRNALREILKTGKRKVICVSCTNRNEVWTVLQAVRQIPFSKKPLLIFALRRPDRKLALLLKSKGIRAIDRHSIHQSLREFPRAEAVVLNTTGEFFEFLRAADLAVIGHDRNLFEPAYLRVPILYFGTPLGMTRKEEAMAGIFGLIWRKNRLAKKFLDRNGGAKRIDPAKFSRQIEETLESPAPFVLGGRKAIREFEAEMIPAARNRAVKILRKALKGF